MSDSRTRYRETFLRWLFSLYQTVSDGACDQSRHALGRRGGAARSSAETAPVSAADTAPAAATAAAASVAATVGAVDVAAAAANVLLMLLLSCRFCYYCYLFMVVVVEVNNIQYPSSFKSLSAIFPLMK